MPLPMMFSRLLNVRTRSTLACYDESKVQPEKMDIFYMIRKPLNNARYPIIARIYPVIAHIR